MKELSEMDQMMLTVYKFVMPIIGFAFTVILSLIASWIRNMAKDMGQIKEEIVKHGMINAEHGKYIVEHNLRINENTENINKLNIQMAKIHKK